MLRDRSLELLRIGYPWAAGVRQGADAARTRLLGREAVVVGGPEGVRRFYDGRLRRAGAVPAPVRLVLFGPGTVHGLDDDEHHVRKALFLDVLSPAAVAALTAAADQQWEAAVRRWPARGDVVLFDEAVQVLGAAVVEWAGVPAGHDARRRARQMAAVVGGFGNPGRAYLRAVAARVQLARWSRQLVRDARSVLTARPPVSVLGTVATARDHRGRLLPLHVAATELLNLLRPTVAVAWFISFAEVALHEHPQWRARIAEDDAAALLAFAQEVRRHYPFVPVLAARARTAQEVLGLHVPEGGLVVLDVHGTLHDPAHWDAPDEFRPERFLGRRADPDLLVPQGGGDVALGHRCPGEDVVLSLLMSAVRVLARTPHDVPPQALRYRLDRMPTAPRSGVRLRGFTESIG